MGGTTQSTSTGQAKQYLTFELAGQLYGLDILRVQEIKGWESPTRLPHSPDYVQGVINLRGAVVPIIELRSRFGLPAAEHGRTTVVIVVRVEGQRGELTTGLVVDAVCEVCELSADSLRSAPDVGTAVQAQYVRGLAVSGERMLVLLDVPALIGGTLGQSAAPQAA